MPIRSTPKPWQAIAAITGIAGLFIVLGHDGRRVAQLLVLLLPLLAWFAWPVRSGAVRWLRRIAVWLWVMAFALDGAIRAYLLDAYQAAPDGALVLGAAANSNARETSEYLSMHWRTAVLWSVALLTAGACVWRLARHGRRAPQRPSRGAILLLALTLLVCAAAYASKPWRRLHPVVFWAGWAQSIQTLRASWADEERGRKEALARARIAAPAITRDGPSTVVLVVTDSINRDNMALYGYGRATTPRLVAHRKQQGDRMLVLRNAWSADASTLPALRNMFGFGQPESGNAQHLLALARAAGYKVWWMSNHDDIAIEQQHARLADVVDFVNRTPGRASASLDGELLDCVQEALEDPAERKFIVVHLLGAHPHYSLRFPQGHNPFDDQVDAVEAGLIEEGRSAWVRRFRQEYDAALLYHDFVVSETLQLTRTIGRGDAYRAWMYLSDHGQEVGHGTDRAGHSPATESGYRIPTVVWQSDQPLPMATEIAQRPFRADWVGWTLADLLHLQWEGRQPARNVLAADYRWEPPALPLQVRSFTD
ncbi:phosphoethanolamine transferase [Variovorax sp. YR216]|uniref:sulfatase-like hydrolase/transferase n=1 Tax=Variovorax sp. YR216 TaxID=1882828 RepID=UPI00089C6B8E|nr:phosphoethanolamine transferase [Variovorax sp. YR216]SEB17709.1 heptose-I-phosphate ethanolaminephosphotransferase [Variovorax sp. YR216]